MRGRGMQHQGKLTPRALRAGFEPAREILRGQGGNFLELLGQLAPDGDEPALQYRQRAGQRLDAVRRFKNHRGPRVGLQQGNRLVALAGLAG